MNVSFFEPSAMIATHTGWQQLISKNAKRSLLRFFLSLCLLPAMLGWAGAERANAGDPPVLRLRPEIQVDAQGVFFDQLVIGSQPFHIRLADAPAFGKALTLTRAQVNELLLKNAPNLATTNWDGAEVIKITRQARLLQEEEVIAALTASIQRDNPQDWGQLEIIFTKPWNVMSIPAEPITATILNLPIAGITSSCIVRFELRSDHEILGTWSLPVQAHLWREVLVAQAPLRRGDLLQTANLTHEKRDVLVLQDAFTASLNNASLELVENVSAGSPLLNRSVRLRPVVRRGKIIDAIVQDGAMMITIKVQALEDGITGQSIKVRNLQSGREFRGKVQNDQAVQVYF